jgi:hypothetical protein
VLALVGVPVGSHGCRWAWFMSFAVAATALVATPAAAQPIARTSIGPAQAHFRCDAASSAFGVDFAVEGPGAGPFEWSMRGVIASSHVTYQAATRPIHSAFLAFSGGLVLRAPPSHRVVPWVGPALVAQLFDTDPFGIHATGDQVLLGIGPAVAAGFDIPSGRVGVRVSAQTAYMPEGLADSRMSGFTAVVSVQLLDHRKSGP